MIALLALATAAEPSWTGDPLARALLGELERSMSLALPEAPPLYHLRAHVAFVEQLSVEATFGSVLAEDDAPVRALGIELRVGDPSWDNTGFGGWENGFQRANLAEQTTPTELREVAWRTIDRAYKEAVEQHARKSSQATPPPDHPGDYTLTGAAVADDGTASRTPSDLTERARELSALFAEAGPRLVRGEVHVGHEAGHVWMVDTEGSRLRRPLSEVTIRALAQLRTDDGQMLADHRLWSVRTPDALPDLRVMREEVQALRDGLLDRAARPTLDVEYVGPVLFEGSAALDLFRWLLVPQLEGTPSEIPFESWFGDLGERGESVRVGRRVLPEGWSALDDPMGHPEHPSAFAHDWEGTPARPLHLVEGGIVKDLAMSRIPRTGMGTNGHARGWLGERAEGRVVQIDVTPDRNRSTQALRKQALKMARAYGRDHAIVVRRLTEPSLSGDMAATSFLMGEPAGPQLPPPVEIVRFWADGREEVLRGAAFASVHRFLLRDIAMAGPQREGTWLAARDGDSASLAPTEGMPTWISAPDVLVREVELVPSAGDPRDAPVLLPPSP